MNYLILNMVLRDASASKNSLNIRQKIMSYKVSIEIIVDLIA